MKRAVSTKDIYTFAKLDMIYNQVRVIEAKQNETKYKCLGSGECCSIGLTIPMAECANIAFKLRQEYYLVLEDKGQDAADVWMQTVTDALVERMYDETWKMGGESEQKCAFFKNGCTIYGYRPMVCRTFGTITTIDNYCPRIRNAAGGIDYYTGGAVQKVIKQYQEILKEYAEGKNEAYDVVVYMPLGVLNFLLEDDDLEALAEKTDPKFWKAADGWFNYRVQFVKEHGYDVEYLNEQAVSIGKQLRFNPED